MDDLDSYLNYVNVIWNRVSSKFSGQSDDVKIAVMQLIARPFYYWVQEEKPSEKPKEGMNTIENVIRNYSDYAKLDGNEVKLIKRMGLEDFSRLKEDLRSIGYLYDPQTRGFKKKQ
ncbi:MAG: hypothetical protein ACP5UV_02775 [Thermoplasmata archaeon]